MSPPRLAWWTDPLRADDEFEESPRPSVRVTPGTSWLRQTPINMGLRRAKPAETPDWSAVLDLLPSIADVLKSRPLTADHYETLHQLACESSKRDAKRTAELLDYLSALLTDADGATDVGRACIVAAVKAAYALSPDFTVRVLPVPEFTALGVALTSVLSVYCEAHRTVPNRQMRPELADKLRSLWSQVESQAAYTNREGLLSQILELRMHDGDDPVGLLTSIESTKARTAVTFLFLRSSARTLPVALASHFYEETLRGLRTDGQHMALRTALQLVTKDPRVGVDELLLSVYTTGG